MTAELVARCGAVEYRGERPCVPPCVMVQLAVALEAPRRRLVQRVLQLLKMRKRVCE